MRFLFLAALIATSVFAQIPGNLGYVPTAQYQTSSSMTLYVSPDGGSDLSCGAVSRPCKNLYLAWRKIPTNVFHNVTVNVASGTYDVSDAGTLLSAKYIDTPVSISIVGAVEVMDRGQMTDAGIYASNAFPTKPTLTDTKKSWTANAYQGMFARSVLADGGVTAVVPIIGNTSTALSLVRTETNYNTAPFYEVVRPGSKFISSTGSALSVSGVSGSGTVVLKNLSFSTTASDLYISPVLIGGARTSSAVASTWNGETSARIEFTNVSIPQTAGNYYMMQVSHLQSLVMTDSTFFSSTATQCQTLSFVVSATMQGIYCKATSSGFYAQDSRSVSYFNVVTDQIAAVGFGYGYTCSSSGCAYSTVNYNCLQASTMAAFKINSGFAFFGGSGISVSNCSTGVRFLNIARGSTYPTWYMSGVSTEITVDATNSTWSAFNALSPKAILGGSGSVLSYNDF